MLILCKVVNCPYNAAGQWCGNPVLSIDMNGMCNKLWKNGQPRNQTIDANNKEKINVIEGVWTDARERDINGDTSEIKIPDGMSESSEEQAEMVRGEEQGYSETFGESGDRGTDD